MGWSPFNPYNAYALIPGTKIKFHSYTQFDGQEGMVVNPVTRYNQKRVVCRVNGKDWRVPLNWINEYTTTNSPEDMESIVKTLSFSRPKIKKGNFWNDIVPGDYCLFYRNGGHFDVVQYKHCKNSRVYCLNPLNGKTYGYDPAWFVCKIPSVVTE